MNEIRFVLNGRPTVYSGPAGDRLLDVLRDTYRCTSVKCGCKEGEHVHFHCCGKELEKV